MSEKITSKATATKDLTASVQRLLEALGRQKSVEPLKRLFWSELNYERANQPLSYRDWPEQTASVLYEAPLLFATGGIDDGFHVVYVRIASDQLSLKDERLVVTRLLKDHLYVLFIFSNKAQDRWHFLNIKPDDKRLIFRRIIVGLEERLRTASEQLAVLDLKPISLNRSEYSGPGIQKLHDKAFDVEAVTKKFFEQYHAVFKRVEQLIQGFADDESKRFFTQRLFNRLMFIAFIQKNCARPARYR